MTQPIFSTACKEEATVESSSWIPSLEMLRLKREASDPVKIMKRELASTKKEAERALVDFKKVRDELSPIFLAASQRAASAATVGIRNPELDRVLREAHTISNGGAVALESVMAMCEYVSAHDAGQRAYPQQVRAKLGSAMSNMGALRGLAAQVNHHVQTLEAQVADAVASQPPMTGPIQGGVDVMAAAEAAQPAGDSSFPRP